MNRLLCQWVDRKVIQLAAARMPQPDGRDLQIEQARALAENFDGELGASRPADVKFEGRLHFHFATPRPSSQSVNNIVHGRFFRCDEQWRRKPVVVMLHGWNDVMNHHWYFPRQARLLNKLALSAATLQLPWHFDRRAAELGRWGSFLNANLSHTLEAALQAVAEIESFVDWLRNEGCPFIALWGVSLGAWLTGLALCRKPSVNAAALVIPVARLDRLIEEIAFCETIRGAIQGKPMNMRQLNLAHKKPAIDREHILLVEAEHDLFMPRETVEELWRNWNQPDILRFPAGHISVLASPGYARRVTEWMAAKARAQAGK